MLHAAALTMHIVAGASGLVIGPIAMTAPKKRGRHTRAGLWYQIAVAAMTATACALTAFAPARLWGLAVIAVVTEGAALAGWALARRRPPNWLPVHVSLMGGSYVSFVTAALVVNWTSVFAWIVPTIIGTPLIARAAARAAQPAAAL